MADSFDGPSDTTAFNPTPVPEAFSEPMPLTPPAAPRSPLIKTAEAIGGTAGKIVHAAKAVYCKLDLQHRSDMQKIRSTVNEMEKESAAFSHDGSRVSRNVVNYFRTHSASEMADDAERVAKRYPVQALAVAAVAGFLFERMLLKRSSKARR